MPRLDGQSLLTRAAWEGGEVKALSEAEGCHRAKRVPPGRL